MACSKLTVGVHEMRAAASGAKTRVVAGFGWFGSDGVELDPRHISRWLQRFFPRVPSKAVRIKPIAVRVDLPETAQHPSSPCSGGSDAVPGTGENRHHHQQHRQQQEATPAAHSRVAQVQGVLAQHEAGLERYTGTEVSDALLLVDGLAAVLKDMGTASPRCYALAHCEEQRRAPHVAARWVEVPRWILEISCTFPRNALFLQMGSGLRDTAAHVVCFDEASKPERHVQILDGLGVFRSAPVCIGHGSHARRVSAGGDSG